MLQNYVVVRTLVTKSHLANFVIFYVIPNELKKTWLIIFFIFFIFLYFNIF